jgi:DNA-binding MarR family transcriptional regulator
MASTGPGPKVVPLSAHEEAFLRAWSRAALTVPRALESDLLIGQGMSLSEYTALMHLSEAPGRTLRMSELASACALSLS